ncbi:MAG TPA: DUF1697 domain-containing protein [Candidatus Woesebacteria bacterium]|nr:DUF1697 domain-containing protein [Candidatus Woesebacteria bacterium]
MKYVALLRGINVGGNSLIKMSELKSIFEEFGLKNVITYINSGNVIFETAEKDQKNIGEQLEKLIATTCNVHSKTLIKSEDEIRKVLQEIPKEWETKQDLRCYIGFLFDSISVQDAEKEVELREEVDYLKTGSKVLYMTTVMSQKTKSKFNKLAGKKLYKEMTIRNFNTTKKILEIMEQK